MSMRTFLVAVLFVLLGGCGSHSPDLTPQKASKIISRTPEFNHSERLISVVSVTRGADSTANSSYTGRFTFQHLDAPGSSLPIKAYAEFRYWDDEWHLLEFSYGCDHIGQPGTHLSDCRTVFCDNHPPRTQ